MVYNIYFDVAALIANFFLIFIYVLRRTLRTKSNKYLFVMLVVDACASLFDIVSCYCISYPERHSLFWNCFWALGYLFFYNTMGVLILAYIDSKSKMEALYKPINYYIKGVLIFDFVLIFTSQWTHAVAYFDSSNVYGHGPMLILLYVLAALHLLASTIIFIIQRHRFNKYQVIAIVALSVGVFLGVFVQAIFPTMLVGQFGNTLVLFFIYTSLENPVYYTYSATTCYNRQGFQEILKMKLREKSDISIFAFAIRDFDNFRSNYSLKNIRRLSSAVAEFISSSYGEKAFCIDDDKFFIMLNEEYEAGLIKDFVEQFFSKPIKLVDTYITASINSIEIFHIDTNTKADNIETGIIYALEHNLENDKKFDFIEVVDKLNRQRTISKILKHAIENDLFDVYYQPIMNVENGKFQSCEALIRLIDSELGFISPEEFIPIAEKEGLILQIGEIVFEKVCKFINEYRITRELGVRYVEINLSPIQCMQPDIIRNFRTIMDKYDIVPFWINLEITETAGLDEESQMVKNIEGFHQMGISFSLDDYGSGFASADYLFRLPVEIVKIDKSILWNGMKDVNAGIILISTLKLLKTLGKEIVVEGVENEEMVNLLVDNGCDFLQGYYYSKPVPAYEFVEFLKKNL